VSDPGTVFWAAFAGGAAAGTVGFVTVIVSEWLRWWLDRPLLVVGASLGYILAPGGSQTEQQVFLEARNPRSKPVTVMSFGFVFKKRAEGSLWLSPVPGYSFPQEVAGGKSLRQWIPTSRQLQQLKDMNKTPVDLKWVYFDSADGKTFRGRIHKETLRALQKQFQESG